MFWFKKAKQRKYPAAYSEWVFEFRRLGDTLLQAPDAEMLSGGVLKDRKNSITVFKKDLSEFLEKQLGYFFEKYRREIATYTEENNCEYLMLVIRRCTATYENLFFFEDLEFLAKDWRAKVTKDLRQKMQQFRADLLAYFKKVGEYTDAMAQAAILIQRQMQA